jgi:hypothetical protein
MNSATTTIPLLPCASLDESLAFWEVLGYEVTHRQKAPNPYGVIRYDDYELHLFGLKQLDPADNFTTCLVIVPEVEQLHETFAGRLRSAFGRVPGRGFPRISRMRPGQTRFTLTDVAGNSVIFIKRGDEDEAAAEEYKRAGLTPLQRALAVAARLRDFKNDDAAAAKALDGALARHNEPSLDYARALAARIELAEALGEPGRARELRAQLEDLPLSAEDRRALEGGVSALDESQGLF